MKIDYLSLQDLVQEPESWICCDYGRENCLLPKAWSGAEVLFHVGHESN
jgi:hypothetical protein